MRRARGGLVFEAHRLLYHTTLGLGVIKKKQKKSARGLGVTVLKVGGIGYMVQGVGFRVQGSRFYLGIRV